MSTVINTNVSALNSHRALSNVSNRQARSSERLSTGQRINRAADDAAGLAISEKMRSQIRGLDQASRNAQDGISLIQTAEGAMQEIQDITQRIRELTVQAANDTLDEADRTAVQAEITHLASEVSDIVDRTAFNGQTLLNDADDIEIQNGANADQNLTIALPQLGALVDGLADIDVDDDHAAITAQLEDLDGLLAGIADDRANLGALQNRLEHTINNLNIASENTSASESRIRDTDMAREMMQLTQANVLQQAATSMLAQANQSPQGVLQLLN